MDQSKEDVLKRLSEKYLEALILSRDGQEAKALRILLDLLYDPRLPHYIRGLVHFIFGGMDLPKCFGYNLFYAKTHILRAAEAFESELAEGNTQMKQRIIELLHHARAVALEPFQRDSIKWELLDDMQWKYSTTGGNVVGDERLQLLNYPCQCTRRNQHHGSSIVQCRNVQ